MCIPRSLGRCELGKTFSHLVQWKWFSPMCVICRCINWWQTRVFFCAMFFSRVVLGTDLTIYGFLAVSLQLTYEQKLSHTLLFVTWSFRRRDFEWRSFSWRKGPACVFVDALGVFALLWSFSHTQCRERVFLLCGFFDELQDVPFV